MEISSQVLMQVITMMILVAVGFVCNKTGILPDDTERPLSNLLLSVVLPALIIDSYQREYSSAHAYGILIAFALAVISHLIGITVSYIFVRKKGGALGIERFAVIYSNCGFMAIPLINAVIGSDGVFYSIAYVTVFNLLNWTHGACMICESKKPSSILKIIFSPMIISIVLAMTLYFSHITLPNILGNAIRFIADINTPLAMIVTGICISKAGILKTIATPRAYYISFLRLILIPVLTILLFKLLPVGKTIVMTNIIATACSSAVSVILFAGKYQKDSLYASKLVAISTVLSLITIPLVVWFADFILL